MPASTRLRRLLPLLLLWAFAATTARALRGPNDFALAHWLLDYRLGFLKRALPGSLVALLTGGDPGEPTLVAVSWLVFAASTAALLYALWQIVARDRSADGALLALVLVGSPLVVMHAHLVGYLDGIVIALAVPAIALALRGRVAAGALLMAVAVPMHESSLVVALPAFLLAVGRSSAPGRRRADLRRAAAPALGVFALLAAAQALQPPGDLRDAATARLATHAWLDPVIAGALPGWLTDSFVENLRQCADGLGSRALWAVAPVLVAPALLAALWQAWPGLRARRDRVLFAAVCALPQTAHLFAWDGPRIWAWSLLAALLAVWVVAATPPMAMREAAPVPGRRRYAAVVRPALVAVMLLDLGLTIPLMDAQADHLPHLARLLLHLPVLAAAVALARERPGRRPAAPPVAGPQKSE